MNDKKNRYGRILRTFILGFIVLTTVTMVGCKKEEVKAAPAPVEVNAIKIEPQTVPVLSRRLKVPIRWILLPGLTVFSIRFFTLRDLWSGGDSRCS